MQNFKRLFFLLFAICVISGTHVFGGNHSTNNAAAESKFADFVKENYAKMELSSKGLDFEVFKKAITGYYVLLGQNKIANQKLCIVDFDKPSVEKRLWVIDWAKKELMFNTLVAHGRNSGENLAVNFSNTNESNMSSLGFYLTATTYNGKHGNSLVLKGLDEGFNTNAEKRCIVMHGADYVSDNFIKCNGRLGRSHGCPAIPTDLRDQIIAQVKEGSLLYINKNLDNYSSKYLDMDTATQNWANSIKN